MRGEWFAYTLDRESGTLCCLLQLSLGLVSIRSLLCGRFEGWRWPYECGMGWSHVNASQFKSVAFEEAQRGFEFQMAKV